MLRRHQSVIRQWVGLTLTVAVTSILVTAVCQYWSSQRLFGRPADRAESSATADQLAHSFKQVAKEVRASVVSVSSIRRFERPAGGRSIPRQQIPEELRRFFGDDSLERFFEAPQGREPLEQQGLGSGVIASSDGYIITNNHVVQDADELTITLHDGVTHKAEVVGTDQKTDVAVLKISAQGLTAARLGDADLMEVGDWVLAIAKWTEPWTGRPPNGDSWNHQCQRAARRGTAIGTRLRRLHPNRRGHQSGKQRRTPVEPARRSDRDQYGDRIAFG